MTVGFESPQRWCVYRVDPGRSAGDLGELVSEFHPDLASWVRARGGWQGQRFLIGPDGRPDLRVNAFFSSPRMRKLKESTNRDYAYSVGVWLNFLLASETKWWEAAEEDAEGFLFWRMTDPANEATVQANSFARDLAGLKTFYRWVGPRFAVPNPFDGFDPPRARRQQDVKWLDPAGYARWRDLGLRGFDLSGRPDRWWRGRNDQRDVAFADGLYGNGLRVSEWASVVLPELPHYDGSRGYFTSALADACAKGGYGHPYWTPRVALKGVLAYVEGARAAAVRRAQAAGRYENVDGKRLVLATSGRQKVTIARASGGTEVKDWNVLGPRTRLRLFRQTPQGLEPLALWLNEDGLPRDGRGWEHTFDVANERIEQLGLDDFRCTAHMLRHSVALKWYSVGKLVYASRLAHLTSDEARDFRAQFGDTWHLVQRILGHRRVETTQNVYLEPFRDLDVELLLAHADGFPVAQFMADAFRDHPQVRTDPMAVAR